MEIWTVKMHLKPEFLNTTSRAASGLLLATGCWPTVRHHWTVFAAFSAPHGIKRRHSPIASEIVMTAKRISS